jgi:hypothetical protein
MHSSGASIIVLFGTIILVLSVGGIYIGGIGAGLLSLPISVILSEITDQLGTRYLLHCFDRGDQDMGWHLSEDELERLARLEPFSLEHSASHCARCPLCQLRLKRKAVQMNYQRSSV